MDDKRREQDRWSRNYLDNINEKYENKQMQVKITLSTCFFQKFNSLREEREMIYKVQKDLEDEKQRKEQERLFKVNSMMKEYKDSIENKKVTYKS